MKLWVVAVGQKVPAWAQTAWDEYAKRFPPDIKLTLKTVKTVFSHVHALGQCRDYMRKKKLTPVVAADTAGAARDIAELDDPTVAAIASKLAQCGITMLDAPNDMFTVAFHYLGLDGNSQRPEDWAAVTGNPAPIPAPPTPVTGHQEPSTLHDAREKSLDVVKDVENQYPRQGSNL